MTTLDKRDNMMINRKGQVVLVLGALDYSSIYAQIQQFRADKFVLLLVTEISEKLL